jgi:hypothetical protein
MEANQTSVIERNRPEDCQVTLDLRAQFHQFESLARIREHLQSIRRRLSNSAVVWTWGLQAVRLGSGLLLLPLLVRELPTNDLGMYYIFLSMAALGNLIDFGFAGAIGRAVGYAFAGATELKSQGVAAVVQCESPNYRLLSHLLQASSLLYRRLAVLGFLLVGGIGTYIVWRHAAETSSTTLTWMAWSATLAAAVWEIYAGWWYSVLAAINQLALANRFAVLAYGVRLVVAAALLLAGGGLLSVPVASFFSTLLQRILTRRSCLLLLAQAPRPPEPAAVKNLLRIIWPNTWRQGMVVIGRYVSESMNPLICATFFGLAANAAYGLSFQIIILCQGIAAAWWTVKMPLIQHLRARNDLTQIRRVVAPRIWLQAITFVVLAAIVVLCSQALLEWIGSDKKVLARGLLGLLALNAFLEIHFMFWTMLIFTENRTPYVWPTVVTNFASVSLVIILARFTEMGVLSLILGPLVTGSVFGYWYWAHVAAKGLGTTWFRLRFRRESRHATAEGLFRVLRR